MRRLLYFFVLTAMLAAIVPAPARAVSSNATFDALTWRLIGPFRGGRALAVTGVPGEPNHFYFGAVDGGVWETQDAGRTWDPIFDSQDIASIGALAVAPSDPRTIYVGTGEADMRSDIAYGNGVYKTTDGGRSWSHIGLDDTMQIGAIVVDPHDANVAYVAALGHPYAANPERGVFKTTDGGRTWTKALYKNPDTGAISLAMEPGNPNVIYAALWQTRRPPWNVYPPSDGPGSGLYKSSDGGTTWTQLTNGLPKQVGHIGLSISPAAPHRIYANVDSSPGLGGIYRSDDAGATWQKMDGEQRIWQRGWYFSGITADPKNPDVVYVMDTATYRSTDGGKTFNALLGDPTGDDFHTLWIDPNNSNSMILGSDQGVVVSIDGAKTWSSWYNQPTAQFYHVITDAAFPYNVYGAQQDSGAAIAPSRSRYATISQQDFRPIDAGGENGYLAPDPKHPGVVYGDSSGQGGPTVTRELPSTEWEENLDPVIARPGTVWRNTWTLPVVFSPADRTSLYFAHQQIFRSRDGGVSWKVISPDLSRVNEGRPANLDEPTLADTNGVQRHGVVYTIAPSPLESNLVWAGTDDGYIWVTRDDARTWQNVTPPMLTSWSKVGIIDASPSFTSVAYAAVDRHRLNDYRPYVYRTTDYGKSWKLLTNGNGIPDGSFVNVVREDPKRRGLLYAGTEKGVYVSFDDGGSWESLQHNLPVSSIRDIAVHDNDLIVATHGRSFWVMDDITPLRQQADAAAALGGGASAYLFAPAPAYRVRPGDEGGTPLPLDEPQAQNPPTGLIIDYYLAAAHTPVTIEILDSHGAIVRSWASDRPPKAVDPKSVDYTPYWIASNPIPSVQLGAHRFVWDFHQDGYGLLAPPGAYVVRFTVNGKAYTQNAVVLRDPRVPASNADLRAQYEFAREVAALYAQVKLWRARALKRGQKAIAGEPPADNPDDSMGAYSHDFTSFLYLENQLDYLESAIESADAAPTAEMRLAYAELEGIFRQTLAKFNAVSK